MPLDQIANIAEIIAAALVIVSLIYVGLQIKQNTDTLKLTTIHNTAEGLADLNMISAENSDFADIWFRGLQDDNALQGVEKLRFYSYFHKFFRTYENAHYQFARGALEAEPFAGITKQLSALASMPGVQSYWNERKSYFNESFQAYVDREVASFSQENFKLAGT